MIISIEDANLLGLDSSNSVGLFRKFIFIVKINLFDFTLGGNSGGVAESSARGVIRALLE